MRPATFPGQPAIPTYNFNISEEKNKEKKMICESHIGIRISNRVGTKLKV